MCPCLKGRFSASIPAEFVAIIHQIKPAPAPGAATVACRRPAIRRAGCGMGAESKRAARRRRVAWGQISVTTGNRRHRRGRRFRSVPGCRGRGWFLARTSALSRRDPAAGGVGQAGDEAGAAQRPLAGTPPGRCVGIPRATGRPAGACGSWPGGRTAYCRRPSNRRGPTAIARAARWCCRYGCWPRTRARNRDPATRRCAPDRFPARPARAGPRRRARAARSGSGPRTRPPRRRREVAASVCIRRGKPSSSAGVASSRMRSLASSQACTDTRWRWADSPSQVAS